MGLLAVLFAVEGTIAHTVDGGMNDVAGASQTPAVSEMDDIYTLLAIL